MKSPTTGGAQNLARHAIEMIHFVAAGRFECPWAIIVDQPGYPHHEKPLEAAPFLPAFNRAVAQSSPVLWEANLILAAQRGHRDLVGVQMPDYLFQMQPIQSWWSQDQFMLIVTTGDGVAFGETILVVVRDSQSADPSDPATITIGAVLQAKGQTTRLMIFGPYSQGDQITEKNSAILALMMFMEQFCESRREEIHTKATRQMKRAGKHIPIVKRVTLRKEVPREVPPAAAESGREFSCRWMVRGHWRQQYYRSTGQKKPKYILPFVKGPKDKPLRSYAAEVVVVRR